MKRLSDNGTVEIEQYCAKLYELLRIWARSDSSREFDLITQIDNMEFFWQTSSELASDSLFCVVHRSIMDAAHNSDIPQVKAEILYFLIVLEMNLHSAENERDIMIKSIIAHTYSMIRR